MLPLSMNTSLLPLGLGTPFDHFEALLQLPGPPSQLSGVEGGLGLALNCAGALEEPAARRRLPVRLLMVPALTGLMKAAPGAIESPWLTRVVAGFACRVGKMRPMRPASQS